MTNEDLAQSIVVTGAGEKDVNGSYKTTSIIINHEKCYMNQSKTKLHINEDRVAWVFVKDGSITPTYICKKKGKVPSIEGWELGEGASEPLPSLVIKDNVLMKESSAVSTDVPVLI